MAEEKSNVVKEASGAVASSAAQKAAVAVASRLATLAGGTLGPAGIIAAKFLGDQLIKLRKQIASLAVGVPVLVGTMFAAGGAAVLSTIVGGVILGAIVVSFVFFIINSGAYIVPYAGTLGNNNLTIDNPYIGVTKVPNPPGPFAKGSSPEVTYTVTVLAKQGQLNNVQTQNTCAVLKESGSPACNPPNADANSIPGIIPAGESKTFTYTQKFPSPDFDDTLVTDTFTVTAEVDGAGSQTAAASANITIGNPPLDCPSGWPVDTSRSQVYIITQGPMTKFTHNRAQAVDIAKGRTRYEDAVIIATHAGVVVRKGVDNFGGLFMFIEGMCNGKLFASSHVHFSQMSATVNVGTQVTRGTVLGRMGATGKATGPHEHYEFIEVVVRERRSGAVEKLYPVQNGRSPLLMAPPFIPKTVPSCVNALGPGGCNMIVP